MPSLVPWEACRCTLRSASRATSLHILVRCKFDGRRRPVQFCGGCANLRLWPQLSSEFASTRASVHLFIVNICLVENRNNRIFCQLCISCVAFHPLFRADLRKNSWKILLQKKSQLSRTEFRHERASHLKSWATGMRFYLTNIMSGDLILYLKISILRTNINFMFDWSFTLFFICINLWPRVL